MKQRGKDKVINRKEGKVKKLIKKNGQGWKEDKRKNERKMKDLYL